MQEILFLGILSLDSQHQKTKYEVEDGMRLSKDLKNLTNLWKVLRIQESTSLQYILKIKFLKISEKYPRLKNSSLSLNFSKDYLKTIKEICKESRVNLNTFWC